ncbi:MAG: hypothetical protein MRK01_05405 [Candidatus Scalindua sp.]|nr:hypothetical protein [Candidatus Scalindua sp.]
MKAKLTRLLMIAGILLLMFGLYSTHKQARAASPIKLNGSLVNGGDVYWDFEISRDSSRVVYLADQDRLDVYELYSVPLDGSTSPIKLNGSLVNGGDVYDFEISPDSSWVVYRGHQDTVDVYELYSVPLDGSASPIKLNGSLVNGGDVYWDFEISRDSNRVVYRGDQDTDNVSELYSVPLDGSTSPIKLNGSLVNGGDVYWDFEISPDSNRVVYRGDQDTDNVSELYSVPLDGSTSPIKLNSSLVSGGDVYRNFEISRDRSRVVYLADQDRLDVYELYSVPLDDSPQIIHPAPGVTLRTDTVTFNWCSGIDIGIDQFWFSVGTSRESFERVPWGDIFSASAGLNTTQPVTGIPLDGNMVHARLWWRIGDIWEHADYAYHTQINGCEQEIVSPAPGSRICNASQQFCWNECSGSKYWLGVGSSQASIAKSPYGDIFAGSVTGGCQTVDNIPSNGTLYVRLWYKEGSDSWQYKDYGYSLNCGVGHPEITIQCLIRH